MKRSPNQVSGENSCPASPLDTWRQFGYASCVPPLLSAAVAQFWRSEQWFLNKITRKGEIQSEEERSNGFK